MNMRGVVSQAILLTLVLTSSDYVQAQTPPNIVVFIADDLGWNDISWHDDTVLTPNLQRLADEGVVLEQSYVQPMCTPTRSALLTGYFPYHLGRQEGLIDSNKPQGLTISKTLLSEKLKELGYSTHLIGKWHLGFCDWAYTPTFRGFDSFRGYYSGAGGKYYHNYQEWYDFRDDERVMWEANGTYCTDVYSERALEILEQYKGDETPLYLQIAFQNVHTPTEVPDEYSELYPDIILPERRRMLGMVSAIDDAVGRVVDALHSTRRSNNTLIIFFSDNGAYEEGRGVNEPLRGFKSSLWEGGTRVPGMMNGPMLENTPRIHQGLLHVTDWYNTLLTVAGAQEVPQNDGFDQWEALRTGLTSSPRDSFIYNLEDKETYVIGGIRQGKYKYIMGPHDDDTEELGPWLFNLEDDPYETTNLVTSEPTLAAEMEATLLAQLESLVPADLPDPDPASDPENWGGAWSPGWCTAH